MRISTNFHNGKLAEVSPFGTGFIEDLSSDTCYGFHVSMLFENNQPLDLTRLEGMQVRFSLSDSRTVDSVCLVHCIQRRHSEKRVQRQGWRSRVSAITTPADLAATSILKHIDVAWKSVIHSAMLSADQLLPHV